jgi:hypothetical protein
MLAGMFLAGAASGDELPESVWDCLDCHEDSEATMDLGDGSEMSVFVDPEEFAASVHGADLECTDCHEGYDDEHPEDEVSSRREYVLDHYEVCKTCHFDTYTRTLESVHYHLLKEGLQSAPVCTDCHGAHGIQNPHEKRTMVSRSCAACHTSIYERYAESVHGSALVENHDPDVPACADCHAHHRIEDARTARFRLSSPEICIRCHGDAELMSRYGISATVASTYLSDFHGVTASLASDTEPDPRQVVVTCVDCHGVHDMQSPKVRGDEEMRAVVSKACQRCHEDASPDFPAAWLSHYEPSLEHAPLVYLVGVFYKILIPFIVIGLVVHVLLHLFRVSAGR